MKKKKLKYQIAKLEDSVKFLMDQGKKWNDLVKEQTITLSSYEHDFQVQKDEISKQGQYIDSLEEQLGRAMAENKDLEQRIKHLQDLQNHDRDEIERLQDIEVDRNNIKEDYQRKLNERDRCIKDRIEDYEKLYKADLAEIERLNTQIEQCIKDKMDLSVRLSIAKEKENRMYSVDNAEIKRLRHVEVERDKLKKEMVVLNKIITEQDNDIDLLGATIQELEANKEKLESELKR